MLAFAERAQVPMYYVSTAFVANPPSPKGDRFAGAAGYIDSKIEAEQLTRESAVPTVIVRPSVVIGDSRDGRMAGFQGLHRVAGMIARGMVPLIACDPEALIDTVPQDVVAAAMGRLLRQGVRQGEFWLTAGATAITAGDVMTVSLELGRRLGLNPTAPRFIAAEAVDRLLVPLLEDAISPELRKMFAELLESTWLFQMPRALPTSLPELGFAEQVTRTRLRTTFELSMDFWARSKGLLADAPSQALARGAGLMTLAPPEPGTHVLAAYRRHFGGGRAAVGQFLGGMVEVSSQGAWIEVDDGRRYLDFGGYGVFILGHRHPRGGRGGPRAAGPAPAGQPHVPRAGDRRRRRRTGAGRRPATSTWCTSSTPAPRPPRRP